MISSFETIFRGEIIGKIRDLRGFLPHHREPEACDAAAAHFIETIASEEVSARAEELFQGIRRTFRFKRRELQLTCDGGGASIQTPDFDLILMLEQHPESPADYRLLTELRNFRNPEIISDNGLLSYFNAFCETVVLRSLQPVSLEEVIDRIEEVDELAEVLDYDSGCTWLKLTFPTLLIEMTGRELLFRLPGSRDLPLLLGEANRAIEKMAGAGALAE